MDDNIIQIREHPLAAAVPLGFDYEAYLCALFSLRCFLPENNIATFWIAQNVKDSKAGLFEDIVLHLEQKPTNGTDPLRTRAVCIQSKHCQGKKMEASLKIEDFNTYCDKNKDNISAKFSLPKHYESVWQKTDANGDSLLAQEDDISYVIFTNRSVDLSKVPHCTVNAADHSLCGVLNTASECHFKFDKFFYFKKHDKNEHRTQIEVDRRFLGSLYIYANQKCIHSLPGCVEEVLARICPADKNILHEVAVMYIQFFMDWAKGLLGGSRLLYKQELSHLLVNYFLKAFKENGAAFSSANSATAFTSEQINTWVEVTSKRDFIVVQKDDISADDYVVCKSFIMRSVDATIKKYSSLEYKPELFINIAEFASFTEALSVVSRTNNIKDDQKLHYALWIFNKAPMVLRARCEASFRTIQNALSLTNQKKVIVFVENAIPSACLDNLNNGLLHFTDLDDNLKTYLMERDMKFQGREVKVKDVLFNGNIKSAVLTSHVVQMILERFRVGGDKLPKLPTTYIKRTLQPVMVKAEALNSSDVKYVIACECKQTLRECVRNIPTESVQDATQNFDGTVIVSASAKVILVRKTDMELLLEVIKGKHKTANFAALNVIKTSAGFGMQAEEATYEQKVNVIYANCEESKLLKTFKTFMDRNCLKYDANDVYLHSQSKTVIPFNCQYIVTNNEDDFFDYQKLVFSSSFQPFSNTNIRYNFRYYVLHMYFDNRLEWVPTYKHYKDMKQWIIGENYHNIPSSVRNCFLSNMNVISGGPGMGKSVLMDEMYQNVPPNLWLVRINLNAESPKFDRIDILDQYHQIINTSEQLLKEIIKFDSFSAIDRVIFYEYFVNKNIYILLDGYDEMVPHYGDKIIAFIRGLYKLNLKVLVTTRPVQQQVLEKKLNCFSRIIHPFRREEQTLYLSKFFCKEICERRSLCEIYDGNKVAEFIITILNATARKMSAWDLSFAGIPLQTFMIATVYLEHCIGFLRKGIFEPTNVDMLDLYEKFITITIKHDRSKRNLTDAKSKCDYEKGLKYSLQGYQRCALSFLFNVSDKSTSEFIAQIQKGVENFGLIENVNVADGKPIFIHRTFAEYLVAKFLYENYGNCDRFFETVLNDGAYDIIRNATDRLLAEKREMHLAVLNRDPETAVKIGDYASTDAAGRTALHLASSWGARHRIPEPKLLKRNYDRGSLHGKSDAQSSYCYHRAETAAEPVLDAVLKRTELWFDSKARCGRTALDFSMECLALANTDALLGFALKRTNPVPSLDLIWKHCSTESPATKYHQILYLCSMYDYVNLTKLVLRAMQSENINLSEISFGFKKDSLAYVCGLYGSTKTLDILPDVDSILKATASLANCKNTDAKLDHLLRSTDLNAKTALMYASEWGNAKTVEKLLESGANFADEYDCSDRSAPMYAAERERHKVCSIFLKESCRTGRADVVRLILKAGTSVNVKLKPNQRTPLMVAAEYGQSEMVKLLLKEGASVDQTDDGHFTALALARKYDRIECAHILENHNFYRN